MRIHASIRPPVHVLAHLEAALAVDTDDVEQLSWLAPPHWRLHIAGFGNVVRSDVILLSEVLAEQVSKLPPPNLRMSAVTALPEEDDTSVWVGVEGDLASVDLLASSIPRWVKQLGFVLDRRAYRSRIQLARITPLTTLEHLQGLVERLGSYEGPQWTAEYVTLGSETLSGPAGFDAFDEVSFSTTT